MKILVGVLPHRRVALKQPELPHHPLWHMKLNRPIANQWAAHEPERLFLQALRVNIKPGSNTKLVPTTIRLPLHLQHITRTCLVSILTREVNIMDSDI